MAPKPRICVGMSGGVDSSVTAYLLKQQGYDVIGLTFRGWPQDCRSLEEDRCCGPQAVMDARMVAHSLGIPHYVIDEIDTFRREVMDYFAAEYQRGRTPNPCIICNERVKFGSLLRKARTLGAEQIATGHYARVVKTNGLSQAGTPVPPKIEDGGRGVPPVHGHGDERAGRPFHYRLRRARDERKDQSYFLFSLSQEQLGRAVFPLGELTKEQTRAIAKEIGLKTYGKQESQEVCFVPENDYRRFLREGAGVGDRSGEIVTRDGRRVGEHAGIHNFTIGQREGLNIGGLKRPLYVVALDSAANRVIVGTDDELMRDEFQISHCTWSAMAEPSTPVECTVKIRSNSECVPAAIVTLSLSKGLGRVRLHRPQRAVTPGQAAVFYQDDLVIGGGWIC
ncbi:MAG TPA: tRNA 2-thiouridine(34) synthase MnmA [Verrucomicrobiae bacterium]|nr:tRNA 2-thiouridine(34) synthase MnmA [Verrucomicrobiae bacterium]